MTNQNFFLPKAPASAGPERLPALKTTGTAHLFRPLATLLGLSLLAAVLLASCERDPVTDDPDGIIGGEGLFVLNEGNFQWGNASLSYFRRSDRQVSHGLFRNANGEDLGDILQSMHVHDGLAYLVVNGSGKIEVVDPASWKRHATIDGLTSPRHFLPVGGQKAYVTDLFSGQIQIIDLETNEASGTIPADGWTEELGMVSGTVLVCGVGEGRIYLIDPDTDQLTGSVEAGPNPVGLRTDHQGHAWVLCAGDWMDGTGAALLRLDKDTYQVAERHELPVTGATYSALDISPDGRTLYFLGGGVHAFPLSEATPEPVLLVPAGGRFFYGLGADPSDGKLFVSDAIDFTQKGKVYVFDPQGQALYDFDAMNNPRGFYFY
jgi:DNA-binding beta-propeller fold protein YncE